MTLANAWLSFFSLASCNLSSSISFSWSLIACSFRWRYARWAKRFWVLRRCGFLSANHVILVRWRSNREGAMGQASITHLLCAFFSIVCQTVASLAWQERAGIRALDVQRGVTAPGRSLSELSRFKGWAGDTIV